MRGPGRPRPRSEADINALEARRQAVDLIAQVLRRRRPFDEAFAASARDGKLASLPERDRALVRAIAATALRRLGQIERHTARYLPKPLPKRSGKAREILLVGAAQVLFMRIPPHAAVDTAVAIARADREARHFAGLINAVLRRIGEAGLDAREEQETVPLNTPAWLMRRWTEAYGEAAARKIAEAHAEEPPLDLSVKDNPQAWAERLGGMALPTGTVRIAAPRGRIEDLPGYGEGGWWVQDAAAALPARLLGDVRGLKVADLCAAPGGKTAQLALAGALVTAVDRSAQRLERLQENLSRLALRADPVVADATEFAAAQPFDAVLLDAPCSATGIIRRNPDIPYLKTEADIAALAEVQKRMLDHAAGLVRPGGLIVYCTCSLEPEEGEDQIRALLARDQRLARVPIEPAEVGGAGHLINRDGDLRTLPFHALGAAKGLDGFFAGRLRRR